MMITAILSLIVFAMVTPSKEDVDGFPIFGKFGKFMQWQNDKKMEFPIGFFLQRFNFGQYLPIFPMPINRWVTDADAD